jgi:hypothetical protein
MAPAAGMSSTLAVTAPLIQVPMPGTARPAP